MLTGKRFRVKTAAIGIDVVDDKESPFPAGTHSDQWL